MRCGCQLTVHDLRETSDQVCNPASEASAMFGRRGILLIASIAVATAAFLRFGQPTHEKLAKFEELRPGLFRHSLEVSPLTQIFTVTCLTILSSNSATVALGPLCGCPRSNLLDLLFHLQLPVATWLLKGGQEHSWILVDSGVGLTTYQKSYRAALKSALGRKDKIKLLLLTHSHTDHTEVRIFARSRACKAGCLPIEGCNIILRNGLPVELSKSCLTTKACQASCKTIACCHSFACASGTRA